MTVLDDAYRTCEVITRREARNFSYGIRLLPRPKRRAMSALYAFARRIDDIGDADLPVEERLRALGRVREDIDALAAGHPSETDPVLVALGDAMARYPIRADELCEVVRGCELDGERQRWATYTELEEYCTCVAGSIGRLSLEIFGTDAPERGSYLANRLGIALQLTNILRDIVEDRDRMGRVYLPAEDLERFGVSPDVTGPADALCELIRFEARRAGSCYEEGVGLLTLLDHRSRACVAAMAGIYRRLLERIEADPAAVFAARVSVPGKEKAWVALRSLAGFVR